MKRINEAYGAPGIQREFRGVGSASMASIAHETTATGSLSEGEVKSLLTRRPMRRPARVLLGARQRR